MASWTILIPALVPIRLAPASIIAWASARLRMPPAAFTPISWPHYTAHQGHVGGRGAARTKAGRRFHVVGAGFLGQFAGLDFLLFAQQRRLDDDFTHGAIVMADRTTAAMSRSTRS